MLPATDPTCLVGLGANLGDRASTLGSAVRQLAEQAAIHSLSVSSLYETTPVGGPGHQPGFLNAVARFQTSLSPLELLHLLQGIEAQQGRTREQRWAARPLDLDLLLHGQQVVDTPELVLPHPRMFYRRFVLEPAAEIAGDLWDFRHGCTVAQLHRRLDHYAVNYMAVAGRAGSPAAEIVAMLQAQLGSEVLVVKDPLPREADTRGSPPTNEQRLAARCAQLEAAWEQAVTGPAQLLLSDFWIGDYLIDRGMFEWGAVSSDLADAGSSSDNIERLLFPTTLFWLKPDSAVASAGCGRWSAGPPARLLPALVLAENNAEWAAQEIAAAIGAINDRPRRLPASDIWPPLGDRS